MLPAYEVRKLVGLGGMGAVYEAIQTDLQRRVAIKLLSPALADIPGLATRFRYESRLMASLKHPGLVQVYEAGETLEGHLYYVMEFVDGEDLASRLRRPEKMPMDEVVPLIADVSEALQMAHALGVVHRDVKPGNILLSQDGPPKLGDFGLALSAEQAADPLRRTRVGTTVGTVEYAAPEQLAKSHEITPASDVFSLGVLAYELLTGELPRGNFDPPSVRNPAVDTAFDSVVLHALQSEPTRRFANAGEFRAAFLQAADRRRQQALKELAVRRKMVRRARWAMAFAVVSLLTGGSAVAAWKARQEAEKRRAAAEIAEKRTTDLVQFLLTDLKKRLEPTGNLGAMESVLEKAVEHFRREHKETGRSPDTALKLADVLVAKADVIGVRGMNAEADALYSEAIALAQMAQRASPDDEHRSMRVLKAFRDRSEHRHSASQFLKSREDAQEMLKEAQTFAQKHPGHRATHGLAIAHRAVAHAMGYTKQLDEALAEYLESKRLFTELVAAFPENQSYAVDLEESSAAIGSNAEARGDLPEMLRHFTEYHNAVKSRYGSDSEMYGHAAFRMGVAFRKLARPSEALPYYKAALAIAERTSAKQPGHKGFLNHVWWCAHGLADVHEALGNTDEAANLRRLEAELTAKLAEKPKLPKTQINGVDLDSAFAQLVRTSPKTRAPWWEFCQTLQVSPETFAGNSAAREFFEEWIKKTATQKASDTTALVNIVTAFAHNRLAALWLKDDPTRSGDHARKAMTIREALAAAHPSEPELQWDALSSACHAANADTTSDDAKAVIASFSKIESIIEGLPSSALAINKDKLFFADRVADLLEQAAPVVPNDMAALRKTGNIASSRLLAGLPDEKTQTLRARLTLPSK